MAAELLRIDEGVGPVPNTVVGRRLSPLEHSQYQELAGQMLHAELAARHDANIRGMPNPSPFPSSRFGVALVWRSRLPALCCVFEPLPDMPRGGPAEQRMHSAVRGPDPRVGSWGVTVIFLCGVYLLEGGVR